MSYSPDPDRSQVLVMPDQTRLYVHIWESDSRRSRGVLLFLHGLAEHARRYASFFDQVRKAGWTCCAPDLRGHGLTAGGYEGLGIAGSDGWNGMVADTGAVLDFIRANYPNHKVVVCGYSMGSMLVQRLMQLQGGDFDGAILIATGGPLPGGLERLAVAIKEEMRSGRNSPSRFLRTSFLSYNDTFQPATTDYDWQSRDQTTVSAYIADPFCGIPISCGLVTDYASALLTLFQEYERVPTTLPVLILNGLNDMSSPLNGFVALVTTLARQGMRHVNWRLYTKARHDLLHETNRDEVIEDILCWEQSLFR